jgi:hypothetical protein
LNVVKARADALKMVELAEVDMAARSLKKLVDALSQREGGAEALEKVGLMIEEEDA